MAVSCFSLAPTVTTCAKKVLGWLFKCLSTSLAVIVVSFPTDILWVHSLTSVRCPTQVLWDSLTQWDPLSKLVQATLPISLCTQLQNKNKWSNLRKASAGPNINEQWRQGKVYSTDYTQVKLFIGLMYNTNTYLPVKLNAPSLVFFFLFFFE